MKINAELLTGLSAQSSSKSMIQFFVVVAVALGIASVLIVSVVQKSLVGPSGSGKSTLLDIIGLLDRPTRGRVLVAGTDTAGLDEASLTGLRARALGFVFQFHHLLSMFTALENVMLPAWGDEGYASDAMKDRAVELLGDVGLTPSKNQRPAPNPIAARVAPTRGGQRHVPKSYVRTMQQALVRGMRNAHRAGARGRST